MAELYTNTMIKQEGDRIITQTANDDRFYFGTRAALRTIDTDDVKAPFRYFNGMIVVAIDVGSSYIWKESNVGELTSGGFIYPSNYSAGGINYSSKKFNFVELFSSNFVVSANENTYGSPVTILGNTTFNLTGGPGLISDTIANNHVEFSLAFYDLDTAAADPANAYLAFWTDAPSPIHNKALLKDLIPTLFTSDGVLPGTRTVTMNNHNLIFTGTTGTFIAGGNDMDNLGSISVSATTLIFSLSNGIQSAILRLIPTEGIRARGTLNLYGDLTTDSSILKFYEKTSLGVHFCTIQAPPSGFTDNWVWDLPATSRPLDPLIFPIASHTTTLTTIGVGECFRFTIPYAFVITSVAVAFSTPPTGVVPVFDVNLIGTGSILSTLITVDDGSFSSFNAVTPSVLSTTVIPENSQITLDLDIIDGGLTAAGLKFYIIGYQS